MAEPVPVKAGITRILLPAPRRLFVCIDKICRPFLPVVAGGVF